MRLLANENFPRQIVEELVNAGHDVAWVRLDGPGSSDEVVLQRSNDGQRVLITFDKDFGELVYRLGRIAASGIILFRISLVDLDKAMGTVLRVIHSQPDWSGHYTVVTNKTIRMRQLR